MKIYLNAYKPKELIPKLKHLDNYFNKSTSHIEIISPSSGIYRIENKNLVRKIIVDKPVETFSKFHKNSVLFLDKSYYKEEKVLSQLPFDHTYTDITCFYYNLHSEENGKKKPPRIQLVIEGTYKENQIQLHSNSNQFNNKYFQFVPTDFYFLVNDEFDIENQFSKEELNVFLSHLN
jgi:hypothetical protein